jgi:hypothetical protein
LRQHLLNHQSIDINPAIIETTRGEGKLIK